LGPANVLYNQLAKKWNGKLNGIAQPPGTYVWFLSFTHHDTGNKINMKGITILIR
jgi:hypothetical protein